MPTGNRHSKGPIVPAELRRQREAFRADYGAAKPSTVRRRRAGLGGTADAHYASERDFAAMREAARDMCRNDFAVECTLEKAVLQTVQQGFTLDANTGDAKLDERLKADWDSWAGDPRRCDVQGEDDLVGLHKLVRLSEFRDGDIFAVLTETGHVQLFEHDRPRTPQDALRGGKRRIVHGVELDDLRRRKTLFVAKDELDPFQRVDRVADTEQIPFYDEEGYRQVFQVYDRKRSTQTRGVTVLHAIFDILSHLEDTVFAGLIRQQLVNSLALFIERDPSYFGPINDPKLGEKVEHDTDDVEAIKPGMVIRGRPGEKATTVAPNIQAGDQFAFLRFLLQVLGMQLGLPLGLVLMEASKSFSGWRGEFEQAKLGFRAIQERDEKRFLRPLYVQRVRRLMQEDAAVRRLAQRGKVDVFGHRFKRPSWPYIEPLKDAQARTERMETLQTSPRRSAAEDGLEFGDVVRETVVDNAMAIEAAIVESKRIRATHDVPVGWRDILNRRVPKGSQMLDSAEQPNVVGDEGQSSPRDEE